MTHQFTDNSLLHSDWREQVEYRVEQEMCGAYFYTEPVNMTILGELGDPWTLDDELGRASRSLRASTPTK